MSWLINGLIVTIGLTIINTVSNTFEYYNYISEEVANETFGEMLVNMSSV